MRDQPVLVGGIPAGVGSKLTQPDPGKYASTQECASLARMTYWPVRSLNSPPRNPVTMRDGIWSERSMTAIELAKYSQCPFFLSNKKLASGSCGWRLGSSRVYPKWVERYCSRATALS